MVGMLVTLSLWWAAVAGSSPPPSQAGKAEVTIRVARDGARALILLDRPVTRFQFAQADVVRDGDFKLLTPSLSLRSDAITSATPFQRIEISIRSAVEQRDAKHPAFYGVGDGGVLYSPSLQGDPATWVTRMTIDAAPGQVCAPACGDLGDGFVFAGPQALVQMTPELAVVADPATPAWLVERSRTDLAAAVKTFTTTLRAPLPRRPVLILKHLPGPTTTFVGDVTPGYVTALRFYGPAWAQPDDTMAKGIQAFILHEAFHFWNGGLAVSADGTPTWLHEGGAEYASLLGGFATGVLDDSSVRQRLSDPLTRCRSGLEREGDKGLSELPFLSNQVRYPCGMIIQWAADLQVRRTSDNRRTILDTWGRLIRSARTRVGKSYDVATFYEAADVASPSELRPAALLISQRGIERWGLLPAALNELGADVIRAATPDTRRSSLLFHLLGQNCRGLPKGTGFGFFLERETLTLDGPAGCGALSGNPVVKSIEGDDPITMSADTYMAVQRKCAAGFSVTLLTGDNRTLVAACSAPLPPAPEGYIVRRWREEPTFRPS